jgi:RND family efflux transporter MFP subunit
MRFLGNGVALLGGFCAALLVSCGKQNNANPSGRGETKSRPVRVVRAELQPMERTLQVTGMLSAHDEATVAAQVAGQIEKNHVDVGDRVTAGQELALIDTTSYEALARQSAANLLKAKASATNAAQNLKRIQELQQEKIASTSELDLAVAESGKTQADVTSAEAANAIAQLSLDRSRVKAPFSGAVAARIAGVGNYVAVGTPIFRIVKTDPLRLRLDVPERDSAALRVGQGVRVTVEGDTNIHTGQIARVAPALRETDLMLQVEADVPNRDGLRAGLFAHAQIVVNEHEPGVSVPGNSVAVFAGLEKVIVVREGKAMERNVITGRREGNWVEIVSGLKTGETIAFDPSGLRTGQAVTIEDSTITATPSGTNMEGSR